MEEENQDVCSEANVSDEQSVGIKLLIRMGEPGQSLFEFEVPFPMKLTELEWVVHSGPMGVKAVMGHDEDITGWSEPWTGMPSHVSALKGNVFAAGDRISFLCESPEAHCELLLNLRVLTRSFTPGFDEFVITATQGVGDGTDTANPSPPFVHELPFHINGLEITAAHLESASQIMDSITEFVGQGFGHELSDTNRAKLVALFACTASMSGEEDSAEALDALPVGQVYTSSLFAGDVLRGLALKEGVPPHLIRPNKEEWAEIRAFLVEVGNFRPLNHEGGLTIADTLTRARKGLTHHQARLGRSKSITHSFIEVTRQSITTWAGFVSSLEIMISMADQGTHAMKRRAAEMILGHLGTLREQGDTAIKQLADGEAALRVQEQLLEALRTSPKTDTGRRLHELTNENKRLRAGLARLGHHAEDVITASKEREEGVPDFSDYEKTRESNETIPF